MKKVLYITNIEVPYRVRFFNEFAKHCDLTVLYESRGSEIRNKEWAKSETKNHKTKYLYNRNDVFSLVREVFSNYDSVIVGCFNSPVQAAAILIMRIFHRPFIINLDGETFLEGKGLKSRVKRFVLSGAEQYLVAGEKSANAIRKYAKGRPVIPYYFSSLTDAELKEHREEADRNIRWNNILVVGQYLEYKGLDIVLEAAKMDNTLRYKFVGMGARTEHFLCEQEVPENVEVIPFLQKRELEEEYKKCAMLALPSRQECWGLVINEAASFGTPIVSTWGSGAAVEFLSDQYPQYLAKPGDGKSLYHCICECLNSRDKDKYSAYLLEKSKSYTIDNSVKAHLEALS